MREFRFQMGLLAVLGLLWGCGSSSGDTPALGTVTGTVTVDGKPFESLAVNFTPVEGGRPSFGITDSNGQYKLVYSTTSFGAKTGKHLVTIAYHSGADPNDPKAEMSASEGNLPKGYSSIEKEAEVKPGKNVIDLAYP
ncbi:MAG TPA: hypothetical protein VNQ76_00645 [Planctomicrobium sp.]|nr:hypothetical protein [Planctomicrobium sp.]